MLQPTHVNLLVKGEKPTRASLYLVRKSPTALRQVTSRGERTRMALRRVITKGSVGDEPLRFRMVAFQRGEPVQALRVSWHTVLSPMGRNQVSPGSLDVFTGVGGKESNRQ